MPNKRGRHPAALNDLLMLILGLAAIILILIIYAGDAPGLSSIDFLP